ncbi:unnamed protein product [Arabis nemorensis]|uniref:Protein kinase domain-containing protein n=1 Tax=Arabis nemorensis TaxID=586526 RepID=A0A565BAY0_9BRAS|nr:unnamed protein product [Arabis nemorensis]
MSFANSLSSGRATLTGGWYRFERVPFRGLLLQQLASEQGSVEKTIVFSSKEIEKATESFGLDKVLGHCGQGTMYKGILDDGMLVAVKNSKVVDGDKLEEFVNEVVILSQINHRNIVKILGCC